MKKNWLDGVDATNLSSSTSIWTGWVETFVITSIAVAASYVTLPSDPFRLASGFPWAVMGPLLVGLRYGFAQGFVSALLVLAALGIAIQQHVQVVAEFPLSWAIGVVVVAMISGEFRDVWERRLRRLAGMNEYRAERLEEFTRSFHLLRISHDRLEQTIANSGLSLREGVMRLQSSLHAVNGLTPDSWQRLLNLIAEFGSIEQAAIYSVVEGSRVKDNVLAHIGSLFTFSENDAVIKYALEHGELASVNRLAFNSGKDTMLMAMPFDDASGHTHAILVVRSMPFFAFHEATLKLIAVLGAHGVDHLNTGSATTSGTRFVMAVERVQRDFHRFKLPSMLLKLSGHHQLMMPIYDHIKSHMRAIDMLCLDRQDGEIQLWLLLPLTDSLGARQYWKRHQEVVGELVPQTIEIAEVSIDTIRHLETR